MIKLMIALVSVAFLISCSEVSLSVSSSSLENSSSSASSLVSSSSTTVATSTSSSSVTVTSSTVANTSSSISSSSIGLASIWIAPMGNLNANDFYGVNVTLPSSLNQVNVTLVQAVFRNDQSLYGYAYEAQVDGNAGPKSIRFRVGIANNRFVGFTMVSHREHSGFGVKIIQALTNGLTNQLATRDALLSVLINANASRTGISETYDGMVPALEAILLHYSSQIQVE